jgi:hypothetical protein
LDFRQEGIFFTLLLRDRLPGSAYSNQWLEKEADHLLNAKSKKASTFMFYRLARQ